MIGVYILIAIFGQFSPANFWSMLDTNPSQFELSFRSGKVIQIGAPVLAEGELIGKVSAIGLMTSDAEPNLQAKRSKRRESYEVVLRIAPHFRPVLRRGTVALIASPLSTTRVKPETVVELIVPPGKKQPPIANGEEIKGYSSYEEFWHSGFQEVKVNLKTRSKALF